MKSKSYYKLSHKRENMKEYKWDILAYDPYKIMKYKFRLAKRFNI